MQQTESTVSEHLKKWASSKEEHFLSCQQKAHPSYYLPWIVFLCVVKKSYERYEPAMP